MRIALACERVPTRATQGIATVALGGSRSIAAVRSAGVAIRLLPSAVMRLPAAIPALAAGEPGSTWATSAPDEPEPPKPLKSGELTLTPSIAVGPTCTVAE